MHTSVIAAQVAEHFLAIPFSVRTGCNWGLALDNSVFDVDDDIYINGFVAHFDFDYRGLYLLEVVERADPSLVSWLAVEYGEFGASRSAWYPCSVPQPFFARTVDRFEVIVWASDWLRSMGADVGPVDVEL
jgi:hypothetical protein